MISFWICPHCREPLEKSGGSFVCVNGHVFDVAKEGYVNLMTGRQKSGHKGDTLEMLGARRQYFERGFYEPLRQKILQRVAKIPHDRIAEVGCGEGYYIGGISEHINSSECVGTDIAKEGIRLAAKRYPRVQLAAADTNVLVPLADHSVDVLLDIFAPRNTAEFARVLKPHGRLLVVIPTQRHLAELRTIQPLLAIQQGKRQAVEDSMAGYVKLVTAETLTTPLRLDGSAVSDLIRMTPNAWFLTDEQTDRLKQVQEIAVTAQFELLMFQPV